jgi:UDP-N-acetylmuramoyl-tripeptide--D-alanyl-D-alanine ligase
MAAFDPDILARWTGGRWTARPAAALTGFTVDSRQIVAGQAFVALRTEKRDGHDFLEAARAAGASAALVGRADPGVGMAQLVVTDPLAALQAIAREHRRTFKGMVAAVTGSAGKTSTKELLALLLGGTAGGVLATEANLNNQIGVALTLTRIDPARHRFAVVEAGISGPDEMRVLAGMIEPDLAIVTLVAPAHLAELGTLENVAREKAAIASTLRKGGVIIYPSACEQYPAFRSLARQSRIPVERVELLDDRAAPEGRAQYFLSQSAERTSLDVGFGPPPPAALAPRRVAAGEAPPAARAVCAAIRLGASKDDIQRRIPLWAPSPLRGEWKVSDARRIYLDCYNANPAAMADALEAFNAVAPRDEPRLFVIGCMEELGAGAPRFHSDLGRSIGLRPGDRLFVIGGHADAVRKGAVEAGADSAQVEIAGSVEAVAAPLAAFHGSVFIKGSRRYGLERALSGAEHAEAFHA